MRKNTAAVATTRWSLLDHPRLTRLSPSQNLRDGDAGFADDLRPEVFGGGHEGIFQSAERRQELLGEIGGGLGDEEATKPLQS